MASGQETLLSYFRTHNENFDKRIGVNRKKGSEKGYWQALNHLTKFLKEKYKLSDIPFSALDRSFIDKFDLYLKIDRRLAPGTIVLLTTRLGTIIGEAITEGIITKNPFAGYEPKHSEWQQKYLTRKELNKLITTPLITPKQYLIRDLFLFSCYTGIPYCDMCKLTNEDVSVAEDNVVWIKTFREKTGIEYKIPLLEILLQILERYRGATSDGRAASDVSQWGTEQGIIKYCSHLRYLPAAHLVLGTPYLCDRNYALAGCSHRNCKPNARTQPD